MLLHCKRDELRKLWIEGIEHKHVLNLLDEIENIKQVPQKLEQCMASKHYLSATDMLVREQSSLVVISAKMWKPSLFSEFCNSHSTLQLLSWHSRTLAGEAWLVLFLILACEMVGDSYLCILCLWNNEKKL